MNKTLIIIVITLLAGCVPAKRTTKTDRQESVNYTTMADELRTQRSELTAITQFMQQVQESITKSLDERINYTENHYDSLGRLITSINQTTDRTTGEEVKKSDNTNYAQHLTASQVDSIMAKWAAELKSDTAIKEIVIEKVGLAWWQQLLMVIEVISIIYFAIKIYLKTAIRK